MGSRRKSLTSRKNLSDIRRRRGCSFGNGTTSQLSTSQGLGYNYKLINFSFLKNQYLKKRFPCLSFVLSKKRCLLESNS